MFNTKTDSHVTGKYVVKEVATGSERADSSSYRLFVVSKHYASPALCQLLHLFHRAHSLSEYLQGFQHSCVVCAITEFVLAFSETS